MTDALLPDTWAGWAGFVLFWTFGPACVASVVRDMRRRP